MRLVYAPPASIGEYGGEIDNWMYPRHTGDFALLRAYVSADGTSQEFNTANVPYASKNYLKISARGVGEGDFVMFRANSGTRFKVAGKEYRLLNDDSIEAVVADPRGITRA